MKMHLHRNETTLDVYVENPRWKKLKEFADSEQDHYMREEYNERLRSNDFELYVFTNKRLYNILYLSLIVTTNSVQ